MQKEVLHDLALPDHLAYDVLPKVTRRSTRIETRVGDLIA
jgi:hypothetical protein